MNNEIGVKQPLKEIGEICRERGVFFHTDAAQAVGKVPSVAFGFLPFTPPFSHPLRFPHQIPINVQEMKIDLLSISGHKIYGPKGVGALYVSRKPRVRLVPIINGGGQERGHRSGTLPTPLIVGLGAAAAVAKKEMANDRAHAEKLFWRLYKGLTTIPEVTLNGDLESRWWGCLNMSFACVEGESLLMGARNVAVSSGSACTSASLEPSYVLRALGVAEEQAHTSIRFGIGRFTTEREIDFTIETVRREVARLRDLSPLWEMHQEGIDLKTIQWTSEHT